MRYLLDTHTLLWFGEDDPRLSSSARAALSDEAAEIFASAANAWEIATKHRLGKLPGAAALAADFTGIVDRLGFAQLPISVPHGQLAGALPGPHKDPFDRMLAAQALIESLQLVSNDKAFDAFGVRRLW